MSTDPAPHDPQDRRERIVVRGRLDVVSAPDLRRDALALIEDGQVDLLVDLSDATFIDSAGLASLVHAMKRARESGGDVHIVRPRSDDAYYVFELTKFDEVFVIRQPGS
jgi:anti-sigma B factor antagonist